MTATRTISGCMLAMFVILYVGPASGNPRTLRQCLGMNSHVNLTCDTGQSILVTEAVVGYSQDRHNYRCPLDPNKQHCIATTPVPAEMCNMKTACSMDETPVIKIDLRQGACPHTTFIQINYTCNMRDTTPDEDGYTTTYGDMRTSPTSGDRHNMTPPEEEEEPGPVPVWMIIVAVVVCVLVLVGLGLAIYCCRKKRTAKKNKGDTKDKLEHGSLNHKPSNNGYPRDSHSVVTDGGRTSNSGLPPLPPTSGLPPPTSPDAPSADDTLIVDNVNYASFQDQHTPDSTPSNGIAPSDVHGKGVVYPAEFSDFQGSDMVDNANYASVNTDLQTSLNNTNQQNIPGLPYRPPARVQSDLYGTQVVDNATYISSDSPDLVITPASEIRPDKPSHVLPAVTSYAEDNPYDVVRDDSEAPDIRMVNMGYDEIRLQPDSKPMIIT